jgi:N-acetylglucosaminyldiphosphoundecaprenol N-acetyl-beta-D-mannosaminyltransferase
VVCGVKRLDEQKYSGLTVAGARNGYFSAAQERDVAEQIAASRADLLFVAISSPQKEQFLDRYQARAALDAEKRPGMVLPVFAGTAAHVPPLFFRRYGVRLAV